MMEAENFSGVELLQGLCWRGKSLAARNSEYKFLSSSFEESHSF